jgi:hypothetical protein
MPTTFLSIALVVTVNARGNRQFGFWMMLIVICSFVPIFVDDCVLD